MNVIVGLMDRVIPLRSPEYLDETLEKYYLLNMYYANYDLIQKSLNFIQQIPKFYNTSYNGKSKLCLYP